MGYAELCVSCDNRTDELRLLGNGVVPATAHKAFLTLIQEFTTNETITKTA
jgi:DNA (cytosine-5)-methyltransferase 1